jgi:hypothetical protein
VSARMWARLSSRRVSGACSCVCVECACAAAVDR